jgi:hypothetical protein
MKILSHFIWSVALLGALLVPSARAADAASEARIVKIVGSGSATVTVNGQAVPASEQMVVPLNAVIKTSGQEIYLEVGTGVVATVKNNSEVAVDTLTATDSILDLRQGRVITQIDKNRKTPKTFGVKVGKGVAAARGTGFTVTNDVTGFSITTTADSVSFTGPAGTLTIQAGQYSFTPAGSSTPGPSVSLATAASDPQVAAIIRDAVSTAATVVQNNLGSISADAATSILTQTVAVAVTALPQEATTFTSTAISAATASGSATATSPEAAANVAGAVTAAAVTAAPDQASAIAGAAAAAAPGQSGVITAVAQQVAPTAKDAIAQQVAASTGQSTSTVQSNADASSTAASSAVNTAKDATSNVVSQPQSPSNQPTPSNPSDQNTTPVNQIDPTQNVTPAI